MVATVLAVTFGETLNIAILLPHHLWKPLWYSQTMNFLVEMDSVTRQSSSSDNDINHDIHHAEVVTYLLELRVDAAKSHNQCSI